MLSKRGHHHPETEKIQAQKTCKCKQYINNIFHIYVCLFVPLNPGMFHLSSHFKQKEIKVQLMALVVPFAFHFGFDGSPVHTIDPSTSTHEQDVSEYGCLTE